MPETTIKTILKLKRGSANGWAETDTILEESEPGYDSDNKSLKIGDGQSSWPELPTFLTDNSSQITHLNNATINNYVVGVTNDGKIQAIVGAGDSFSVLGPAPTYIYIPANWNSILTPQSFANFIPERTFVIDDTINGQIFNPYDYGYPSNYNYTASYNYDINNVILLSLRDMINTVGTLNSQLETTLNGGDS